MFSIGGGVEVARALFCTLGDRGSVGVLGRDLTRISETSATSTGRTELRKSRRVSL